MAREERTGYRRGDEGSDGVGDEDLARRGRGSDGPPAVLCDLCGGAMMGRHCRLVCLRCGYQRDCSDP